METHLKAQELVNEIKHARLAVKSALTALENCPEVNPNNYAWEDVEQLESAINEAITILGDIQL